MKFLLSDIKLKSPGVQIRERIIEKYGSITKYAEEIELYESSINQYLASKKLGSSTFKIRTTRAFGEDFDKLYLSEEEQISQFVSDTSLFINEYNRIDDYEIFKRLEKLSLEREMMEEYAVVCRCYAHYFFNQGKKERAFAYIDAAVNTMRGRDYIDRFGLYLSDMIFMKAKELSNQEFKKSQQEFNEIIKSVTGPLTTGHMYRNMAKAFFEKGDLLQSELYYRKVFEYHLDPRSHSFLFMRLADIKKAQGEYDEALNYYSKSETLIDEKDVNRFFVYNEYAKYYLHRDQIEKANKYMDMIFDDSEWVISSFEHDFVRTYLNVKFKLGLFDKVRVVLERLLNDLDLEYIHASYHIYHFAEGINDVEHDREFLKVLNRMLIKHLDANKLDKDSTRAIKQLIGDLSIHFYHSK